MVNLGGGGTAAKEIPEIEEATHLEAVEVVAGQTSFLISPAATTVKLLSPCRHTAVQQPLQFQACQMNSGGSLLTLLNNQVITDKLSSKTKMCGF